MKLLKVLVVGSLCLTTLSVEAQSWKNALKNAIQKTVNVESQKQEEAEGIVNPVPEETQPAEEVYVPLAETDIPLTILGEGTNESEAIQDAENEVIGKVNTTFSASASKEIIKKSQELTTCVTPDGKTYALMYFVIDGSQWLGNTPQGASTGLASFGSGFKKDELCKKNSIQILDDILVPIGKLIPVAFNRTVTVQPEETSIDKLLEEISPFKKDNIADFANRYAWHYDPKKINTNLVQAAEKWMMSADNSYLVHMKVNFEPTSNMQQLVNLVDSTFKYSLDVQLTDGLKLRQIPDYRRKLAKIIIDNKMVRYYMNWGDLATKNRNDSEGNYPLTLEEMKGWKKKLDDMFYAELFNFAIMDNTGGESSFPVVKVMQKVVQIHDYRLRGVLPPTTLYADGIYVYYKAKKGYMVKGKGLFSPFVVFNYDLFDSGKEEIRLIFPSSDKGEEKAYPSWEMTFLVPKSDISKYTSFQAIRK